MPLTREQIEKMMVQAGHLINRNNGQCGMIEDVAASVTSLGCQLLEAEMLLACKDEALGVVGLARPKIVCLCGSARFYDAFQKANYEETMAGKIVLSVGHYPHIKDGAVVEHGQNYGCTPEQKVKLDELHLRKIDMADEVLILNVGGYIGESTRRELDHAKGTGKVVRFLE